MSGDAARVVALRLRSQGLTGARARGVAAVAERLVGIQAQDLGFARLAFRPRCAARVVASDVDRALDDGTLIWTWAMRGTLHLVPAADAGWLVGLLGPIFAGRGRPRRLALGLDDAFCERALAAVREVLAEEGPQTRAVLAERAGLRGGGQAPAHLMVLAGMRGIVRRMPGSEPTFALRDAPAGVDELDEDAALARLAQRYLTGHAPARPDDLAAWAGIGMRRARRAFTVLGGAPSPATIRQRRAPHVALLGHFDPWLLGYASRELVLDPRHAERIQTGGGFIAPAVIVDGRVVGTWRREAAGWLEPFEPLPNDVLRALEVERADVERFLTSGA